MNQLRGNRRSGVGLLEVIACTGLVALMIVPLAGVIRASGQSIAEANGDGTTAVQMRRGLRYLARIVREGEVQQINQTQIRVRMPSGQTAAIRVRGGKLELRQGVQTTILAENVRRARFIQRRQRSGARLRTGVDIRLIGRDPDTRRWVRVNSAVAIPPQV